VGRARWVLVAILAAGLAACSTETDLTIHAQGENANGEVVPLTNVTLDVIPYDIDQLYDRLESQSNPGAPPQADTLKVLAKRYQDACASYRATSDSIETLQKQAGGVTDRTSPEYKKVFEQYQALTQREKQRFQQCQDITDHYTEVRNAYRDRRKAWEQKAWPEEQFAVAESTLMGENKAQRVETDKQGTATVTVPNGTWWILGDAPVPGSISQQYRWNVKVDAQGKKQTVELNGDNAELEPVY